MDFIFFLKRLGRLFLFFFSNRNDSFINKRITQKEEYNEDTPPAKFDLIVRTQLL